MGDKVNLSLRWGSHQETVLHSLEKSFGTQDFVDLTLACEGQSVEAHRVVVSACSSFLKKLLQDHPNPHPIVILKDVTMSELKHLLEFMYCGQVTVEQTELESLLHAAQVLGIRGLTDMDCAESSPSTSSDASGVQSNTPVCEDKKAKNVLSGNESILAKYLSIPPSAQSLSLAELLAQPALNENSGNTLEDQEHNGSVTDSVSEIDLDLKTEEIDLGIETEFENSEEVDPLVEAANNFKADSKSIGKATAFMLSLAKRANREAALPYSSGSSFFTENCLICGQTFRDKHALKIHTSSVHSNKLTNSGGDAEQKLAFYESRPCSTCGKIYRDAASLRTHVSIMHTAWRDGFECPCKQVFHTKYEMYQHRRSHRKNGRTFSLPS